MKQETEENARFVLIDWRKQEALNVSGYSIDQKSLLAMMANYNGTDYVLLIDCGMGGDGEWVFFDRIEATTLCKEAYEVSQIRFTGDALGGYNAIKEAADWLLDSKEVAFESHLLGSLAVALLTAWLGEEGRRELARALEEIAE